MVESGRRRTIEACRGFYLAGGIDLVLVLASNLFQIGNYPINLKIKIIGISFYVDALSSEK